MEAIWVAAEMRAGGAYAHSTVMLDAIAAGPFVEATVYIQITRGVAPRTHVFPADTRPLEFLFVQEF